MAPESCRSTCSEYAFAKCPRLNKTFHSVHSYIFTVAYVVVAHDCEKNLRNWIFRYIQDIAFLHDSFDKVAFLRQKLLSSYTYCSYTLMHRWAQEPFTLFAPTLLGFLGFWWIRRGGWSLLKGRRLCSTTYRWASTIRRRKFCPSCTRWAWDTRICQLWCRWNCATRIWNLWAS